ncbi:MAG: hypothetical protein ACREUW_11435 [Burkholderiales bacterium]
MRAFPIVLAAVLALLADAPPATAAQPVMACEQFASVAYSTEQARKKGTTLKEMYAEADQLGKQHNLSPEDVETMKAVIGSVFNGSRNWMDIMEHCKREARQR